MLLFIWKQTNGDKETLWQSGTLASADKWECSTRRRIWGGCDRWRRFMLSNPPSACVSFLFWSKAWGFLRRMIVNVNSLSVFPLLWVWGWWKEREWVQFSRSSLPRSRQPHSYQRFSGHLSDRRNPLTASSDVIRGLGGRGNVWTWARGWDDT